MGSWEPTGRTGLLKDLKNKKQGQSLTFVLSRVP